VVIVLVLLTIATFLTIDYFVRRRQAEQAFTVVGHGAAMEGGVGATAGGAIPIDLSAVFEVPGDAYLAATHTWVRPDPARVVRVGAGRLPLHALGGVDQVRLADAGVEVRAGDPLVVLRHGDREIRLRSPIDGVVETVNREAVEHPDRVMSEPFDAGWLLTVRPRNLAVSLRKMFVAEEAAAWMRREMTRLRDAISGVTAQGPEPVPVLLDGGVPMSGFAERLTDQQWSRVVEIVFAAPGADDGPIAES
jgi:glycine cleavage system H protein